MRFMFYIETPYLYTEIWTHWLIVVLYLPNCKWENFLMNCDHTKCLSWNIKYCLSCWVNSTRITWCLCFFFFSLRAATKHRVPSLEKRKLVSSFSGVTAQVLRQLEWLQLCCCLEKSHVKTALGQVLTLQVRFWLGSSAQLLCFCACLCVYMGIAHKGASSEMLPFCPKCSMATYYVSSECAVWVKSICGLWEQAGTIA